MARRVSVFLATDPIEVLIRAFEITCITMDDQYDFIQRSPAYPSLPLSQFVAAWESIVAAELIFQTRRTIRCRSHRDVGYCYGFELTSGGVAQLKAYQA